MIDKEIVLVRVNSTRDMAELITDLEEIGVKYCRGYRRPMDIPTKNLILRCVIIPRGKQCIGYIKGMRASGCFGFDTEAEDYLTRGDGYTLTDYVKEIDTI